MNQQQFEQTYREQWQQFRRMLERFEDSEETTTLQEIPLAEFPRRYRKICNHYSLAKTRHYRPALVDDLHELVLRGHRQLYQRKTRFLWQAARFIGRDFPGALRRNHLFFWLALLLFTVPAVLCGIATYNDPVLIYSILEEQQVSVMETMYSPENKLAGRSPEHYDENRLTMFGYYILNNISIGFKTFSGGILFGLGAVFFLIYNGIILGGVSGHLSHQPFAETFWQFVCGHGPFELTAIVICGGAGMLLGASLVMPGELRRLDALRLRARAALPLVIGGALMLVIAAFIEAFWSPSAFPPTVKFAVSAIGWLLVIGYFLVAGRKRHES